MDIGFEDDIQLLNLAFLNPVKKIVQTNPLVFFNLFFPVELLSFLCQLAGHLFIGDVKSVAGFREIIQANYLHRLGRTDLAHLFSFIIDQSPDFTGEHPGDHCIPQLEGTVLDQDRSHRAAAFIQFGLDHRSLGRTVGIGS